MAGKKPKRKSQTPKRKVQKKKSNKRNKQPAQYRSNLTTLLEDCKGVKEDSPAWDYLGTTPFSMLFEAYRLKKITKGLHTKSNKDIEDVLKSYEVETNTFRVFGNTRAELKDEDIANIFGLPAKGKRVDLQTSGSDQRSDSDFSHRYFLKTPKISHKSVKAALGKALEEQNYLDVARLLVLDLFISLFFSNSTTMLPWNYFSIAERLEKLSDYNWPTAINQFLKEKLRTGQQYKNLPGCTIGLLFWLCEKSNLIQPIQGREQEIPALVKWNLSELHKKLSQQTVEEEGGEEKGDDEGEAKEEEEEEEEEEQEEEEKEQDNLHQMLEKRDEALECQSNDYTNEVKVLQNRIKELESELQDCKNELQDCKNELQDCKNELKDSKNEFKELFAENRRLYNEVQDFKGNIRLYCRIRPFPPKEMEIETSVEHIGANGELLLVDRSKPEKRGHHLFKFNAVFGPEATQAHVYADVQPLVRSVLDGYNVCLLAYGQTGSGKTYTMTGDATTKVNWGINYRALHDLFEVSKQRSSFMQYEIELQMVEVYNEKVHDLLSTDGPRNLAVSMHPQPSGLAVVGACMHPIKTILDALELMDKGSKNRAVGATALNKRSSRSHSVVTIHVRGTSLGDGPTPDWIGNLQLVDLAGNEDVRKSQAVGDRLVEAKNIKKSLSALGDVMAALAQKRRHVPYRNSQLTKVLQRSLGGNAKTAMLVQINPKQTFYNETLRTLQFAKRVSTIELGAARPGNLTELTEQQLAALRIS